MASKTAHLTLDIGAMVENARRKIKSLTTDFKKAAEASDKEWKEFEKSFSRTMNNIRSAGQSLTLGITLPLAAAGAAGVKMSMDFEQAFTEVLTLLDEGEVNVAELKQGLLGLAQETPQSIIELTKGLYQLISAGVEASDALDTLGVSAKAAVAGVTDTFTAVDGLTNVLNAYSLEASEATRISDIMFATVREGKLTFPQLSSSIGTVISSASLAKVSLEDLFAAIATITKGGLSADEATVALNQTLLSFISPAKEAAEVAQKYGVELNAATLEQHGLMGAMEILSELFNRVEKEGGQGIQVFANMIPNVRALRGAANLAGTQFEEFRRIQGLMVGATGATSEAFGKMSDTLQNRVKLALETARVALMDFAELILPTVEKAVAQFKSLAEWLQGLPAPIKSMIVTFGAFLAILGPIITGIGVLIPLLASLQASLVAIGALTPFGWVVAAIAAVGALGVAVSGLSKHSQNLSEKQIDLNTAYKETIELQKEMAEGAETEYGNMAGAAVDASKTMTNVFSAATIEQFLKLQEEGEASADVIDEFLEKMGIKSLRQIEAEKAAQAALEESRRKELELQNKIVETGKAYDARQAVIKKSVESGIFALQQEISTLEGVIASNDKYVQDVESGEVRVNEVRLQAFKTWLLKKAELEKLEAEEADDRKTKEEEARAKERKRIVEAAERKVADAILAVQSATGDKKLSAQKALVQRQYELELIRAQNEELSYLESTSMRVEAEKNMQAQLAELDKQYLKARIERWEKANRLIAVGLRSVTDTIAQSFFDALDHQDAYTRERYELDKMGYDKQEERLRESLNRGEIAREEYNLRIAELNRNRRDAEIRYEEAHAGFFEKVWKGLLNTYKDVLKKMLADYLYEQTRELTIKQGIEAGKTAASQRGMLARIGHGAIEVGQNLVSAASDMFVASAKAVKAAIEELGLIGVAVGLGAAASLVASYFVLKNNFGFAEGGLFRGQGTGTSDSNIIRVSDGEYIVSNKGTKANLPLLEMINSGVDVASQLGVNALRAFADGGLVGTVTPRVISGGGNAEILSELRSLRVAVANMQPNVTVEASAQSQIKGRDLHTLIRVEEKSQEHRKLTR